MANPARGPGLDNPCQSRVRRISAFRRLSAWRFNLRGGMGVTIIPGRRSGNALDPIPGGSFFITPELDDHWSVGFGQYSVEQWSVGVGIKASLTSGSPFPSLSPDEPAPVKNAPQLGRSRIGGWLRRGIYRPSRENPPENLAIYWFRCPRCGQPCVV